MSAEYVHLYMQALIAAFAICLSLLAMLTLVDAGFATVAMKAVVGQRLRWLRMSGMLEIRNIDRRLYVEMTPLSELRRELANCAHCTNQQQCDAEVLRGEVSGSGYAYCPNTPYLNTVVARIRRRYPASRMAQAGNL